ncbi:MULTISPECIES: ATP-binding protein [unclassified Pseudonocardia]|jgi:anti-sigma regulatory factor (Ser/Thr protein kinase)|uniref:ATP-binding protein n=1 Tax=unclassified Pseudonocardia TaxID=2619320 RepID=UPI000A5A6BF2|nr:MULTISPECIES: ATP-binding protein [unclassified Pseudonocardia]MBN9100582.1 ATP-binding protein [Pseudonocardia sp.]
MTTAVRRAPQHEAVLHSGPAELARLLAPRIRATAAARHVVVAVLDGETEAAVRAELGTVADDVEFRDPAEVHAVPAFTVAVRFARTSRRAEQAGGRALVIAQHLPDLTVADPRHWARLDIALNVAIAGLPVTVLCAGPAEAATAHPSITTAAGTSVSGTFRPPAEAVIDHPPPPPPDLGPPAAEMAFGAAELARLRHRVSDVAGRAGLASERVADLVLAVNELASNSVEHGPGTGRFRLWTGDHPVAEISDGGGPMDAPFPGLTLPPPEGVRGRGLWLASELCDVLQVWSDTDGTVVRVTIS